MSTTPKHKVFISYHHANDQGYKNALVEFNEEHKIFIDASVDIGEIDDRLNDQAIRTKIRDEYLADSSVTILLVGAETSRRKHIDWEIYSSMHDGVVNKKSGILVINLPTIECKYFGVGHGDEEKAAIYPDVKEWVSIDRAEYERRYPYMPSRIIDNLVNPKAKISVVNWDKLNVENLRLLIELAYRDRAACQYDLSSPMRRFNS